MKEIAAGEFKAKCLSLLDEVAAQRRGLVITKRGKPVARLLPMRDEKPHVFGRMAGTIRITGDIVAPTGETWDAEA